MSEVRSALVWEKGSVGESPLTVTLQEVEVQKKHLVLAIVCQGKDDGSCPQLPAGYLCESMVGWFYNEVLPLCKRKPELPAQELEQMLKKQWERAVRELQEYGKKRNCKVEVTISGILLWGSCFVAFGNRAVYVLNRRFNRPRKKNILPKGESVTFQTGEVNSFLSFYLESEAMTEIMKEEEILESLYTETFMEERKLEKRLGELGKATLSRMQERSAGAIILEVEP
ncbi:MAG: hypothetical protein IJ324_13095 [Lachnospiraceae bacterium]|nr:hypothetical protein [Lachnospiraceae bacterium]